MRIHEFFMPMIPPTVTHQTQKLGVRNGKPFVYPNTRLKDARAKLTAHLGQHRPDTPLEGPLRFVSKWCFPLTNGKTDGQWKDTKPDCSNIIKLPEDVMTDLGFWSDDAKIASLTVEEFWAKIPGIWIHIEELV